MDTTTVTTEFVPPSQSSGARLRTCRKRLGWRQVNLAMAADTGEATINKAEKHNFVPGYLIRKRICRVLGVEMADIWPDVDDSAYL